MNRAGQVNRELARLDSDLRRRRIDLAAFRAQRRRLLLDFEEHSTTTARGASARMPESVRAPEPDAPTRPFPRRESPAAPGIEDTKPSTQGRSTLVAAVIVAAALVTTWLWLGAAPDDKPQEAPLVPQAASVDLPQDAASALIDSDWSEGDIADFLRRWRKLPPEAIRAAADDPRVWLLRGETETQLRNARDAQSLDQSAGSESRIRQLETLQRVIRAP
ncbi:MAG: hypothetical protein ACT4PZ_05805 [Panacagrimonas sp.]